MIDKSTKQHYEMQGKVKNYLGKQKMVKAPKYWKSGPDHPDTELAYITKAEKDLILKADLHGSLSKGPNRGPSGIISLNSAGSGYGGPGPGGGGGGGGGGGRDRWDRSPAPAPAPTPTKSPQASRAREEKAKEDKARDEERAFEEKDRPGYVSPEELKTRQIKDLIAKQQEEKYGPTADPDILGERLSEQELPKGHPDRIKEETERAVKQLSTKEGTEEALREFKALKTGRGYTPDINLLEKLGIKKPEGILGSLVDTGKKFFDPKKMAFDAAKNYALKKLGLGFLNPFLGIASLFKGSKFDPFTKGKKPDMSAFNKLGLQTDRVPTQTMDTLTALKARDAYKQPISTQIAGGKGLESGAELLGLGKAKTYSPNDMGTWYDTHPATGEAVMAPEFKEFFQGPDKLNPRTVYDSYEFKDTGDPFKEEVWQRPHSYDSTQQAKARQARARTAANTQTRMSGHKAAHGGRIDRPLMGRSRDI